MSRIILAGAFLVLSVFASAPAPSMAEPVFHFALTGSTPAANAEVTTVKEVRLEFSEAPAENTVSIRVMKAREAMIPTSEVQQSEEDDTVFFVTLAEPLTPGDYMVGWRAMGDDGHVVKGMFSFKVVSG
ncbi:MAG: copper resistance protein CopC [Gemmatimonadota bacterium]